MLAEKYVLRSKWTKNQKRGQVPEAEAPRQVVQMDTVHFGQVFAFTAVDIFTREADVLLRPSLLAVDGEAFLRVAMPRRFGGFVQTVQTDGGSEFEAEFVQSGVRPKHTVLLSPASDRPPVQEERTIVHREL